MNWIMQAFSKSCSLQILPLRRRCQRPLPQAVAESKLSSPWIVDYQTCFWGCCMQQFKPSWGRGSCLNFINPIYRILNDTRKRSLNIKSVFLFTGVCAAMTWSHAATSLYSKRQACVLNYRCMKWNDFKHPKYEHRIFMYVILQRMHCWHIAYAMCFISMLIIAAITIYREYSVVNRKMLRLY